MDGLNGGETDNGKRALLAIPCEDAVRTALYGNRMDWFRHTRPIQGLRQSWLQMKTWSLLAEPYL